MKKINWDRKDSDEQEQKVPETSPTPQQDENPRLLVISIKDDPQSVKNKLIKKLKIYRAFEVLTSKTQLDEVLKDCQQLRLSVVEKGDQGSKFRVKVRQIQEKNQPKQKSGKPPTEAKKKEQRQQPKYQKNKQTKPKESKPYPLKKQTEEGKTKNNTKSALQDALQGKNRYSRY